jgi:hypothetical protein
MYPYKSLTKSQLIELLNIVESTLTPAINNAKEAAQNYSTNPESRYPFEVGFLNGTIKEVLGVIGDYKKC